MEKQMPEQTIIDLLKEIDEASPFNYLTSVRFYSDGSGRIYYGGENIEDFDNIDEAELKLKSMLAGFLKK